MIRPHVWSGARAVGAALVLLLVGVAPALAQATGTIRGTVTARGSVLSGIEVRVEGTTLYGVTGADGRYTIGQVPVGTRLLRATSIGYSRVDTLVVGNRCASHSQTVGMLSLTDATMLIALSSGSGLAMWTI